MQAPKNTLKAAMRAGRTQYGVWLNTMSPVIAEMVGQAGFDWCLIDGEHGANSVSEYLTQLQALAISGTPAVIRIAQAEHWMVKQAIDLGCQTVMVPMVNTADQAAKMAAAMRYPPQGSRGLGAALARASEYGKLTDYTATANDEMCLIVQAETQEALRNIADIAATDGVDCVFIGPADLAADMGHTGNPGHPDVVAAITDAFAKIAEAGALPGFLIFDAAQAQHYTDLGVKFLGVGGDIAIFREALRSTAKGLPKR
jgi:4-hydroxy-2-oxoheptanedioate aldolase